MSQAQGWDRIADRAWELLRTGRDEEAWRSIDETVASSEGGEPAVPGPTAGFREVGARLYQNHRALPAYIALQSEQIRRLEAALSALADEEERTRRVKALGGVYYNLASFTWPGWDDAGIEIGPQETAVGRRAALRSLEIRLDPENADVSFGYTPAMAHWVVGAHALVERDWPTAYEQFARAAEWEREAGEDDALGRGYSALTALLERPNASDTQRAFEEIIADLDKRTDEDASFYREQLLTARRVLSR